MIDHLNKSETVVKKVVIEMDIFGLSMGWYAIGPFYVAAVSHVSLDAVFG